MKKPEKIKFKVAKIILLFYWRFLFFYSWFLRYRKYRYKNDEKFRKV